MTDFTDRGGGKGWGGCNGGPLTTLTGLTDDRVRCTACAHYRPASHRCTNHKRAGLLTAAVGPELAELPQRCPGHAPRNP
jgi:hypothetical protein